VIAKGNDDTASAKTALEVVEACSPRAMEAGKLLVAEAGKRAAVCMRPGGKASDRAQMRVLLKGALRAFRVGNKRK
jgi:hypothetical protein